MGGGYVNIVLYAGGAARKVTANIVCVQANEMAETARNKHLTREVRREAAGGRLNARRQSQRPSLRRRLPQGFHRL